MGMWFLASAYGQYFAGLLGANIAEASTNSSNYDKLMVYTAGYNQLAIYSLIIGIIIIIFSPFIKKLMGEVKWLKISDKFAGLLKLKWKFSSQEAQASSVLM